MRSIRETGAQDRSRIVTQEGAQGARERGNIAAQSDADARSIRGQGDVDLEKIGATGDQDVRRIGAQGDQDRENLREANRMEAKTRADQSRYASNLANR